MLIDKIHLADELRLNPIIVLNNAETINPDVFFAESFGKLDSILNYTRQFVKNGCKSSWCGQGFFVTRSELNRFASTPHVAQCEVSEGAKNSNNATILDIYNKEFRRNLLKFAAIRYFASVNVRLAALLDPGPNKRKGYAFLVDSSSHQ